MIPISLSDELHIEIDKKERSQRREAPQFTLTCNESTIPNDETNLVHRAAALLLKESGRQETVSIYLRKNIPAGAGLGGGSSDAAATLKGLNTLLELGLSEERLRQLGARLGADVPFFIPCRPAHVEGIGEILTIIPPLPHRWLVLVVPPFSVSTPWAYRQFDKLTPVEAPPPQASFALGQWPLSDRLINDLERAVLPDYPQIATIKSALHGLGAEGALMSGSGSSVFGIFSDRSQAETAAATLMQNGRTFLTEPLMTVPTGN